MTALASAAASAAARTPIASAPGAQASPLPDSASYLRSLRDGRTVYIQGQRVQDVASHPAFRNAARSIGRLYDALHDPSSAGVLTCPTDTGSGGRTHRFFRVARSREDLVAAQGAIAHWARLTYGWMGRSPDYKASLTNTFGAAPSFYGEFEPNARRWYRLAQERLPFIAHALANPPIDRHRKVHENKDICVHAVERTPEGLIVSGAKVVATSAAIANWCFIGQTPGTVTDDADLSLAFMVPVSAPGLALICRSSYEHAALRNASPFDAPLSSRFDENDSIITFDRVLIPWRDVLIDRDPERVRTFFAGSGFLNGFLFHGCTRLAVKLDFIAGLLAKALRATGGSEARGKRALLGEAIAWSHTFWSLSHAMASNPEPWGDDALAPNREAALAYCVLAPDCYPRIKDIVEKTVASGLVYLPSSAADLSNPDMAPLLSRYVRGSAGIDHRERIKIMKLLWDAIGSEFGGRHELYERNYAGGWECIRLMVEAEAQRSGRARSMEQLVDACMADYDEEGWTGSTWTGGPESSARSHHSPARRPGEPVDP